MALEVKFGRFVRLTISPDEDDFALEDRVVTELRMVFRVNRIYGNAVSTLSIDIYNLDNGENVSVPFKRDRAIQLDAGYEKLKGTLFQGFISNANTYRDGPDIITRLYCNDFAKKLFNPNINLSYDKPKNLNDLLEIVAEGAGLSLAENSTRFRNVLKQVVFSKPFSEVMDDLASVGKFIWYVFNGSLYVFDETEGNIKINRFEIDASNGLLETPVLTDKGINVKVLMEPKIKISDRYTIRSGGLVLTQGGLEYSKQITNGLGEQQVFSLVHTGDTHGDAWYTELLGLALSGEQFSA